MVTLYKAQVAGVKAVAARHKPSRHHSAYERRGHMLDSQIDRLSLLPSLANA